LGVIQENFEEGYVKVKKKKRGKKERKKEKWNGRRRPIISKRSKRNFNQGKAQQMPKVNTRKNQVSGLLVCLR
jgi:hypothetical protein